jgi:catechol 2,3-dioxygenase-like lactoylglutathione lyase family enzyme
MNTTEVGTGDAGGSASVTKRDMKLEVIVIPVSDVDRAKDFYARLGWRLDADRSGDGFRLVQFTPPGSGCSIQFGTNLTTVAPGSARGMVLVVSDLDAAHAELTSLGVKVTDVYHCATGSVCRFHAGDGAFERVSGTAPGRATYSSFLSFTDPDGNEWVFQEVTQRLPGRLDPGITSYASTSDLASALRRASAAHGQHEARIGAADPNWPDWYADYMVKEQSGEELPL